MRKLYSGILQVSAVFFFMVFLGLFLTNYVFVDADAVARGNRELSSLIRDTPSSI